MMKTRPARGGKLHELLAAAVFAQPGSAGQSQEICLGVAGENS
jgi:hypothetical protein